MTRRRRTSRVRTLEPVSPCTPPSLTTISHILSLPKEYRSAIFYHSPQQLDIAKRVTEEVQEKHFTPKGKKIVTVIEPAGQWWDAEDYHQEYLFKV